MRVSCTPSGERGARIVVDDAGPGIPEGRCADLFKLFHSTKEGGTGVGLAFCRKVIEAHGGSLRLTDGELGGACFEIELNAHPIGSGPGEE